jgi:hypothetical protein
MSYWLENTSNPSKLKNTLTRFISEFPGLEMPFAAQTALSNV